ncbi:MAG: type 4a pilus biogenesis protein PilO [Endozoicomonadaceae bacterium]|nr:type 4a pilus biogenesis protein PilO [Endozoicomonadaceae bacterium]MCY4330801.1 type 4a pilus biogenesis protein PilO [Endozoicomonadaceae bacterium]
MKLAEEIAALKTINLNELDIDTISRWPVLGKGILCLLIVMVIGFLGYKWDSQLKDEHKIQRQKEGTLKQQLKTKAEKAVNIDAYRQQMKTMEETFNSLIHQLPGDTEVPSLLEDITQIGRTAGLEFDEIALQPEVNREFFIELPIRIKATGKYHDIGNFISGVSSLKRIVTLHDFEIKHINNYEKLSLQILAKTYRYKGEDNRND